MKHRWNHKTKLWLGLSCLLVIACLVLPGTIVSIQAVTDKNVVHQAAASFYSSKSQTAVWMTLYERMKLISGEWESHWEEADQQAMMNIQDIPREKQPVVDNRQGGSLELEGYCYMDYYSVLERAEKDLKQFYESGFYPVDPESTYSNWYRPTVTLYQYSDAVFDSYVCYVWLVELEYYDGSMKHTILLDDTTGIILAAGLQGDSFTLEPEQIRRLDAIDHCSETVLDYYRTSQQIWDTLDITERNVYLPHYAAWSARYGLTAAQMAGTTSEMSRRQYLFSSSTNLTSYEAAIEEVKNTVNNDKFILSLQWSSEQCWFYLMPFTIKLEQD